jgi:hypothetical protein
MVMEMDLTGADFCFAVETCDAGDASTGFVKGGDVMYVTRLGTAHPAAVKKAALLLFVECFRKELTSINDEPDDDSRCAAGAAFVAGLLDAVERHRKPWNYR